MFSLNELIYLQDRSKLSHQNAQIIFKLQQIVQEGDIDTAALLLEANQCDFSDRSTDGKTTLFHAITRNDTEMVKLLLEHDCDPMENSYVAYHHEHHLVSREEPPLVTAARTNASIEIIHLLLKNKANPDSQSIKSDRSNDISILDKTAMHWACEEANEELVSLLLEYFAAVDLPDRGGELPIHKAARCRECEKQTKIMNMICHKGACVNSLTKCDCSPSYIATFYGCTTKLEILLQNGADINQICARENSYGTPLHLAAAKDQMVMTNLLLKYGAKLDVINAQECTPLHLNINSQLKSGVAFRLLQHGSPTAGRDRYNYTLMAACINNMRLDCESLACVLVAAGYNLQQDVWLDPTFNRHSDSIIDIEIPEVNIPEGRVRRLCDWLYEQQCEIPKLSQLCRNTIRACLSKVKENRSIFEDVAILPLPETLKDYLLLKDVMPSDMAT